MTAATLTGLLGDEDRLRVVAAIALGARTIDDVSRTGGLAPGEVRRALPRLIAAGVVEDRNGLLVDVGPFRDAARDRPPRRRDLPGATPEQARVLWNFVENGRLKALPVRASQRRVVLEYLATRFDEGNRLCRGGGQRSARPIPRGLRVAPPLPGRRGAANANRRCLPTHVDRWEISANLAAEEAGLA